MLHHIISRFRNRKKKHMEESKRIDLDTLSAEQIDEIAKELGTQLIEIAEETRTKVESLLSKYNLSCKINIALVPKDTLE